MLSEEVKQLLNTKVKQYNNSKFIEDDPISIPHQFIDKQDIEIAAFWTASLAWGQRKTIINKAKALFDLMDNQPYDFILNHSPKDRQRLAQFKHRTFNQEDTYTFLEFLQHFYQSYDSMEQVFHHPSGIKSGLISFRNCFTDFVGNNCRTLKHVSTPEKKSACKRLNMFLRWMVRKDNQGVDFGIWTNIKPKDLYVPLDVHVGRVARSLGLMKRKQNDWQAVEELTNVLKTIDLEDPIKYDFALFSIGVTEQGSFLA